MLIQFCGLQVQKQFEALCEKHKREQESMDELLNAREDAYLDLLEIPAAVMPRHTPAPSHSGPLGASPASSANRAEPPLHAHGADFQADGQGQRSSVDAARPRPNGLFGLGGFF